MDGRLRKFSAVLLCGLLAGCAGEGAAPSWADLPSDYELTCVSTATPLSLHISTDSPEELEGQVVFQEDGCSITVGQVSRSGEGEYTIRFQAAGGSDDSGRRSLISAAVPGQGEYSGVIRSADLSVEPAGLYTAYYSYQTSEFTETGNEFEITVVQMQDAPPGGAPQDISLTIPELYRIDAVPGDVK